MTQVEFHVLSEDGPDTRFRYACHLAEEAVQRGERVYLQTATAADAQRLDELLWTFNDRSFLPHEIAASPSHPTVRVLLGDAPAPPDHRQLLINLTEAVPPDIATYERIHEVVPVDPERKRAARERFRQYRDSGHTPTSKNVARGTP